MISGRAIPPALKRIRAAKKLQKIARGFLARQRVKNTDFDVLPDVVPSPKVHKRPVPKRTKTLVKVVNDDIQKLQTLNRRVKADLHKLKKLKPGITKAQQLGYSSKSAQKVAKALSQVYGSKNEMHYQVGKSYSSPTLAVQKLLAKR